MSNWRSKKSCCKRNMHYHGYRYPSSNDWSCQISGEQWNFNPTFNSFNPALRFDENIDFVNFEKALTSPCKNSLIEYFSKNASSKSKLTRETTYQQSPVAIRQGQNQPADEKRCFTHNYIQHQNCTTSENSLPDLGKDLKAMEYLSSISASSDRQKMEADFVYSNVLDADMLSSQFDAPLRGIGNYLLDGTNYVDSQEEAYNMSGIPPKGKELHDNGRSEIKKVDKVNRPIGKIMGGNTFLLDNLIKEEATESFNNTTNSETNTNSVTTLMRNNCNTQDASIQTQTENIENNRDIQVQCNIYDNSLISCAESFIHVIKNFSKCDLLHKTLQTVINSYSADQKCECKSNCKTDGSKCQTKKFSNQECENSNLIKNSKYHNAISNSDNFSSKNAEIEALSEVNGTLYDDSNDVMLKESFKLSNERNTKTSRKSIDKELTCKDLKCRNVSKDEDRSSIGNKKNNTQHISNSTHNVLNSFKRKIDLKDKEYATSSSKKLITHHVSKTSDQNNIDVEVSNINSSSNSTEKTIFRERSYSEQTTSVKISKIYEKTTQVAKHTSLPDIVKESQKEVAEASRIVDSAHRRKKFKSSKGGNQDMSGNTKISTHHKIKTSYETIPKVENSVCDSFINVSENGNSPQNPLPGQTEKAKNVPKMSKKVSQGKICKLLLDNLKMSQRKNTHTLRKIEDKLNEIKSFRNSKAERKDISEKKSTLHAIKAPYKDIKGSEKCAIKLKNDESEKKAFDDISFSEQTKKIPKPDVKHSLNTTRGFSVGIEKLSEESDINTSDVRILKLETKNRNCKKSKDGRHDTSGKKKTSTRHITPNKIIMNGEENDNDNKIRRSPRIMMKKTYYE